MAPPSAASSTGQTPLCRTRAWPRPRSRQTRERSHYHKLSEEIYFILEGSGEMDIDGEKQSVGPGDAILIPPGAWHEITATTPLRFLCCCAPPYSHDDTYFE